jgi:hypothetical protein
VSQEPFWNHCGTVGLMSESASPVEVFGCRGLSRPAPARVARILAPGQRCPQPHGTVIKCPASHHVLRRRIKKERADGRRRGLAVAYRRFSQGYVGASASTPTVSFQTIAVMRHGRDGAIDPLRKLSRVGRWRSQMLRCRVCGHPPLDQSRGPHRSERWPLHPSKRTPRRSGRLELLIRRNL